MARSLGVQSKQLLTESEIFEDQVFSGTESTDNPSEERSERRDDGQNHGQNFIETRSHQARLQVVHSASTRSFDEGQGMFRAFLGRCGGISL